MKIYLASFDRELEQTNSMGAHELRINLRVGLRAQVPAIKSPLHLHRPCHPEQKRRRQHIEKTTSDAAKRKRITSGSHDGSKFEPF